MSLLLRILSILCVLLFLNNVHGGNQVLKWHKIQESKYVEHPPKVVKNIKTQDKSIPQLNTEIQTAKQTNNINILCSCYRISLISVFNSNINDNICYKYSVIPIHNDNNYQICKYDINNLILGICDNDINKYTLKSLNSAIIHNNINQNNIEFKVYKSYENIQYQDDLSIFGIKVNNFITHYDKPNQFTLCMEGINKHGITSNMVEYTINNQLARCPFNDGLPCTAVAPAQSMSKPTKSDTDIDIKTFSAQLPQRMFYHDIHVPKGCKIPTKKQAVDICVIVDVSCGISDADCAARNELLQKFILSIKASANPRLCYIVFNAGSVVEIKLDDGCLGCNPPLININNLNNPMGAISERDDLFNLIEPLTQCPPGQTPLTNLMMALDDAIAEFDNSVNQLPNTKRIITIFSNCIASALGPAGGTEGDICTAFGSILNDPLYDVYIFNTETYNGVDAAGSTDFVDPFTYLDCLTNNEINAITVNNFDQTDAIYNTVIDDICGLGSGSGSSSSSSKSWSSSSSKSKSKPKSRSKSKSKSRSKSRSKSKSKSSSWWKSRKSTSRRDRIQILDAIHSDSDSDSKDGMGPIWDRAKIEPDNGINPEDYMHTINKSYNDVMSSSTRDYIKYVFVCVMVFICLNGVCCTFFALRQSGALDKYLDSDYDDLDNNLVDIDLTDHSDNDNDVNNNNNNMDDKYNKYNQYYINDDDDDDIHDFSDSNDDCSSIDTISALQPTTFTQAIGGSNNLKQILRLSKESQNPSFINNFSDNAEEFISNVASILPSTPLSTLSLASPFKD